MRFALRSALLLAILAPSLRAQDSSNSAPRLSGLGPPPVRVAQTPGTGGFPYEFPYEPPLPVASRLQPPPPPPTEAQQEEADPSEEDLPSLPPQTVIGQRSAGDEATGAYVPPSQPVVTPTQTVAPAGQFGGTVRVLGQDALRRTGATQVSDALRGVPGLDVVQQGAAGGVTSIFLRGANSQHTKVLLNGIPINDPSNPSRAFDFSTLSLDNVERVEVLQGPQSTLYGSDAMGGVINIITRRGEPGPPVGGLSLLGGSFGSHRESGYVRGGGCSFDYSLGGSWWDTDGFSAAAPRVGGVERDGQQLGTTDGRFGLLLTDKVEAEYFFRWIDARAQIDDAPLSLGSPPVDDPLRLYLSQIFAQRVQLRWDAVDGLVEHVAAYDLVDYDRDDLDDVFPFSTTGQTRRLRYQANLQLLEDNVFSAGAVYWAEDAGSVGFGSTVEATQFQRSAFLQDQLQLLERLFAVAGVRWDDHSAAGSAVTYRVALVGLMTDAGTRLHGSLGTGFRAPALSENLFPFGNPNLAPERSRGWECGLEQPLWDDVLIVGATYYRNDFRDLILFDLATFTLENIGQATAHGLELVTRCNVSPQTFVDVSYTRTDTLDYDTGAPLVRRPRDKGAAILTQLLGDGRTAVRLAALAVGPRTDSRDGSVLLDEYLLFNLSCRQLVTDGLRMTLRVDNLFDEYYEEATGFSTAGLSAYGGVELYR